MSRSNTFFRSRLRISSILHVNRRRLRGAAMMEFIVAAPMLLALGFGAIQTALVYNSKNIVKYAAFEAARKGAVSHAQTDDMREEFGIRIAPLFGGDGSGEAAGAAIARGLLEANDPRYTRIDILNPTRQAFDDFAVTNDDGIRVIPNVHLKYRPREVGASSAVNIQDANILKIQVTYAYELKVPLINRLVIATLRRLDPENIQYYLLNRIPVTSTATVHMQSAAMEDQNVDREGAPGGRVPGDQNDDENEDQDQSSDDDDELDQGGDEDSDVGSDDQPTDEVCIPGLDPDCQTGDGEMSCPINAPNNDILLGTPVSPGQSPLSLPGSGPQSPIGDLMQPLLLPSQTVGNPINVVTGNKFQREMDIAGLSAVRGMQFERFYNSNSADIRTDLGYGWRHSFDIEATRHNDDIISVRQADGRRVVFTREGTVFNANVATDGQLVHDESATTPFIWTQREGTTLMFDSAGRFVRMLKPTGEFLKVTRTAEGRIRQVLDAQGRTLSFDYYANGRLKYAFDPSGNRVHYKYDAQGNLATVTHSAAETRKYHYEDTRYAHKLTGITNELGVRFATWRYDERGRANYSSRADGVETVSLEFNEGYTRVSDAFGKITDYYTAVERGVPLVTEVRGPGCDSCGRGDVAYRYNDALQLSETQYKDGRRELREYDNRGRLTVMTRYVAEDDQNPRTVNFYYPDSGPNLDKPYRITKGSLAPEAQQELFAEYNDVGQLTKLTHLGWNYRDGRYQQESRTVEYVYNDEHQLIAYDGPRRDLADITRYEYDAQGRLQKVIDPVGGSTMVHQYDAHGRPLKVERHGIVSELVYNQRGQLASLSRSGRQIRYEYLPSGLLKQVTAPDGQYRLYHYDAANRLTAVEDNEGNTIATQYDALSRLVSRRFASADTQIVNQIDWLYDIENRVIQISGNGETQKRQYDAFGKLVQIEASGKPKVQAELNAAGQLLRAAGEDAALVLTYDNRADIASVKDARGTTTEYFNNDFGQLGAVSSPDGGLRAYTYDEAGNLTTVLAGNGDIVKYRYDAANRLIEVDDSEQAFVIHYGANGQISEIRSPVENKYFEYNAYGEVTAHTREIDGFQFTTRYEYNELGQLKVKRLANGVTLLHHYHERGPKIGQLKAIIEDRLLWDTTVLADVNSTSDSSLEKRLTFGNGVQRITTKDTQGRVTGIRTHNGLRISYTLDNHGNVIAESRQEPNQEATRIYRYDGADRVSAVIEEDEYTGYIYDALGNRLSKTQASLAGSDNVAERLENTGTSDRQIDWDITIYHHEAGNNRLASVQNKNQKETYEYNEQGSPKNITYTAYEYNASQRPVKVYQHGQLVAEYAYNAWGERVKKTTYQNGKGQITYFLYENQRLVAEANQQGKVERRYLYHENNLVGVWQQDAFFAIVTNRIGAPIAAYDEDKNLAWTATYDVFGKAEIQNDVDSDGNKVVIDLRFPGQVFDPETNTYHNYFRDYDPSTGRYLTSDPSGLAGGLNTFLYANANPLRYTDSLGLAPIEGIVDQTDLPVGLSQITSCDPDYDFVTDAFAALNPDNSQRDGPGWVPDPHYNPRANIWYAPTIIDIAGQRHWWDGSIVQTMAPNPQVNTNPWGYMGHMLSDDMIRASQRMVYGAMATQSLDGSQEQRDSYREHMMMLTLDPGATYADVEQQIRSQLGNLVSDQDLQNIWQALPHDPVNSFGLVDETQYLVDVTPLHEEILNRFLTRLYGDHRVLTQTNLMNVASRRLEAVGSPRCSDARGRRIDTPSCIEYRAATEQFQSATEAYQTAYETVYNELVSQGMLPALDQVYDETAPMQELMEDIFITTLSLFIPLTVEDAVIDAATSGLGRLQRFGRGVSRVLGSIADMAPRVRSMSRTVFDRVMAARRLHYRNFDNIHNLDNALLSRVDELGLSNESLAHLDSLLANPESLARFRSNPDVLTGWAHVSEDLVQHQRSGGSFDDYWDAALTSGRSIDELRDFAAMRNWIHPNSPPDAQWWIYPPNQGFVSRAPATLTSGQIVDRYIRDNVANPLLDDTGRFLGDDGASFGARALDPGMTPESRLIRYEVLRPIDVDAGQSVPWFDQPGGGNQYFTGDRTLQDLLNPNQTGGPYLRIIGSGNGYLDRIPDGYTLNVNGSITGPSNGIAFDTGLNAVDGAPIFRRESGGYYVVRDGRQESISSPFTSGSYVLSDNVWSIDPMLRGRQIEAHLSRTDYASWQRSDDFINPATGEAFNSNNFPLIDFQHGNEVVSLKTVDTRGASWQTRMQEHIEDYGRQGSVLVDGQEPTKILDIRVQPGGAQEVDYLVEYGLVRNVIVNISEFSN